jgi:hypothetical protein
MAYVRQHPDYPKFRKKVGVMPDFSGSNYSDQEKPVGNIDGINRLFTLAKKPIKFSETIHKDGMMMNRASSLAAMDGDYYLDYSISPVTISFADNQIPQLNSVIRVSYKYMGE